MEKQKESWFSRDIQGILALVVFISGMLFLRFAKGSDVLNARIEDMMILALQFYFGGSRSSVKKDETIATLSQQPTVTSADTVNVNPANTSPSVEKKTDI